MPAGDGDLLLWPLPVPGLTLDGTLSVSMVDTVGSTLVLTGRVSALISNSHPIEKLLRLHRQSRGCQHAFGRVVDGHDTIAIDHAMSAHYIAAIGAD